MKRAFCWYVYRSCSANSYWERLANVNAQLLELQCRPKGLIHFLTLCRATDLYPKLAFWLWLLITHKQRSFCMDTPYFLKVYEEVFFFFLERCSCWGSHFPQFSLISSHSETCNWIRRFGPDTRTFFRLNIKKQSNVFSNSRKRNVNGNAVHFWIQTL